MLAGKFGNLCGAGDANTDAHLWAQLERDLIAERVRNGLANAKAKGIHIGRVKKRVSDLIRKLRASGMTFREVARIAKCSTGAVSAEMKALKAEAITKAKIKEQEEALLPKLDLERSSRANGLLVGNIYQSMQQVFLNPIILLNTVLSFEESSKEIIFLTKYT